MSENYYWWDLYQSWKQGLLNNKGERELIERIIDSICAKSKKEEKIKEFCRIGIKSRESLISDYDIGYRNACASILKFIEDLEGEKEND